ncbi:MAG: amino acid adenylation domain-containing protein, partial [Cyanobacteria bacterium J06635_10]
AFWDILRNGVDAITEVPLSRWDIDSFYDPQAATPGKMNTRWSGFLEEVDRFEPSFFGIAPREVKHIDPQQRLLLEVSWEALENAGIVPESLAGSQTGVFIGISTVDYHRLVYKDCLHLEAYSGAGTACSIASNRLSYLLNLRGPSIAIDTACSSSLVAVNLANQSLQSGDSNLCLVGGVNLILSPEPTISFSQARMMASDGRCKTFDASADGYVRGEGCGVVVLKRLEDALRDGDNIQAVIKGSAVNQDGLTNGLTAPNGPSQQAVIRQALEKAQVKPAQISYVETHGSGTSLGDPIEVNSLKKVLTEGREANQTCYIGSVKTNIGHLEAAAGIAGLIKVVLSLQNQEIPPNLHFKQLNPYIKIKNTPIKIPTSLQKWSTDSRLAGVSSFGFGGTNAHIIVEEAPLQSKSNKAKVKKSDFNQRPHHILTLSAQSEPALQELRQKYKDFLINDSNTSIDDICFTAHTGRSHFKHRLAIIASDKQELADKLALISDREEINGVFKGKLSTNNKSPLIAFLFTGQGSQYINMGRQLYSTQLVFRETILKCNEILKPYLEKSLLEVLYPENNQELENSIIDQTAYTQPVLFAIEYALYKLWQSWGIKPSVVMGHSVGEYVAATVAGVFSLEDGLKLISLRGRLMQQLPPGGEMLAVRASHEQVNQLISPYSDKVAIAAINGPQNVVISGESDAVGTVREKSELQGIKTKQLQVSHAFHSHLMEPMLAEFTLIASEITYNQPNIPLISNVTGTRADDSIATANYWVNHVRQPVNFAQGMESLHQEGYEVFLEIGPKPILLGMGRQCLAEDDRVWLPSLRPSQEDTQQMLQSLGELYVRGVKVDWLGFDKDYPRNKVILPTYPFQRQRYWIESTELNCQKGEVLTNILKSLSKGKIKEVNQLLQATGELSDVEKELAPKLLNLLFKQHEEQLNSEVNIDDYCYELEWKPLPLNLQKSSDKKLKNTFEHWLIFADYSQVGETLAQLLQNKGHVCTLLYPDTNYSDPEKRVYGVTPNDAEDFQRLCQEIKSDSLSAVTGIIHLWSLNTEFEEELNPENLEKAKILGCGSVLYMLQALTSIIDSQISNLWLITKGCQNITRKVNKKSNKIQLQDTLLWGLGKVIALEHPEYKCRCLDLAPQFDTTEDASILLEEILNCDLENQIAYQLQLRHVARLTKKQIKPENNQKHLYIQENASYLITGGLGANGLEVAQYLVGRGAKNIVLSSRREPSETAQKIIQKLVQKGVNISVLLGDISQEQDVAKIIKEINSSLPPLKGVVHAAEIINDGLLQSMSWSTFVQVLAPKVDGSWYLHQFTQDINLDFFVCFSSIASLVGSPGQGNYAAANAFMDALAHYRHSMGLPGLSINWGSWSTAGMAANLDSRHMGITPLTTDPGLQIFGQLLGLSLPQVGVSAVEWSVFQEQFSSGNQIPLLRELVEVKPTLKKQHKLLEQLESASRGERQSILTDYIKIEVARVLGMTASQIDVQQSINTMGFDSLMAVELRNRLQTDLGVDVSVVNFLEGNSIFDLVTLILEQLNQVDRIQAIESPFRKQISSLDSNDNIYPLSWAQERLWFLNQLEGKSATYNIPAVARVSGNLDINALQQTLSEIVQRHSVLRTSFQSENGKPIQVIDPEATIKITGVDLQQLETTEQETLVIEQAQLEANTPFSLENDPLIRCSLLQLSTSEYVFLLTMHHIISDGWSMGVFMQELSSLYKAFIEGEESPLGQLPIQYGDFAVWQREYLSSEISTQLDYWKQQLSGAPSLLQLPTDYPRPSVQKYQGSTKRFSINTGLTTKLQSLSQELGTTLFMTLYGAFSTLLYRYSGQSDILIGSPIANRNRSEIEDLIGFFVNTLVLRSNFENNPSFKELLVQVRETTLKAYENQDVPFEQIVEALQPQRSLSHSPLFQVMFVLQNAFMDDVELPGVTLSQIQLESTIAMFDLTLSITETEQGLVGEWEYNTDLFKDETIERMVAHFQNLLEAIVENPLTNVGSLNLLTPWERHQLLVEWNDTATVYPKDKCIHQLFEEQVEKTPLSIAVVFEEEQVTYEQLNQRANQLAHHLQTLGVEPEVLVGICVERSIDMIVGLLGILKAGGAYVPLDPNYPPERLSYMLRDSDVGVLVTQSSLLEFLPEHNAGVVCLDIDWGASSEQSQSNIDAGVTSDNLAYVIYTSGSTGKPKGVMNTHQANGRFTQTAIKEYKITATDRVLQFASINFDAAVEEIYPCLSTGATLVLRTPQMLADVQTFFQACTDLHLTVLDLPTAYFIQLVADLESTQVTIPESLRLVIIGGEKVLLEPVRYWLEYVSKSSLSDRLQLINTYGPTETTVTAILYPIQSSIWSGKNQVPIGRPIANTQIYILDSHLQPVPIGVPGELYIGGDGLTRGYLNRPQLTSEKFILNPFDNSKRLYKTGDLARYLPDRNIEFLSRIDNQVKIRGFRIELGEIEAVLTSHPQVNQAVVIALEENTGSKRLVAYSVANSEITTQQLREYLKEQLPDYMVPSAFVTLDSLPLTPNGKVDRKALPAPAIERDTVYTVPRTQSELQLTQIWSSVLNITQVGVKDNFFDLGGHSLLAVRLMSEIQKQFHKNLPLATLFQSPTIEQLALALVSDSFEELYKTLVPIQPNGSLPPLFCVPGAGGNVLYFHHLARYLGTNQPFYGLQAQGLDGETLPLKSIEEIATQYIQAIQTIQPTGPYFLAGHCFGGQIVFEMATQ